MKLLTQMKLTRTILSFIFSLTLIAAVYEFKHPAAQTTVILQQARTPSNSVVMPQQVLPPPYPTSFDLDTPKPVVRSYVEKGHEGEPFSGTVIMEKPSSMRSKGLHDDPMIVAQAKGGKVSLVTCLFDEKVACDDTQKTIVHILDIIPTMTRDQEQAESSFARHDIVVLSYEINGHKHTIARGGGTSDWLTGDIQEIGSNFITNPRLSMFGPIVIPLPRDGYLKGRLIADASTSTYAAANNRIQLSFSGDETTYEFPLFWINGYVKRYSSPDITIDGEGWYLESLPHVSGIARVKVPEGAAFSRYDNWNESHTPDLHQKGVLYNAGSCGQMQHFGDDEYGISIKDDPYSEYGSTRYILYINYPGEDFLRSTVPSFGYNPKDYQKIVKVYERAKVASDIEDGITIDGRKASQIEISGIQVLKARPFAVPRECQYGWMSNSYGDAIHLAEYQWVDASGRIFTLSAKYGNKPPVDPEVVIKDIIETVQF